MNTFIKLIMVVAALSLTTITNGAKKCTNKDSVKADETGARITTIGKYGSKFPETTGEMTSYCRNLKEDIAYLQTYSKECLNGTTKQLFSMMVYSFKGAYKNFCGRKNKKRTAELLTMGRCANKSNQTISVCLDKYLEAMYGIIREKPKLKVPQVCCYLFKTYTCVGESTKDNCPNYSELIVDFLRNIFQSVVDVACGDYVEYSNKCSTLGPAPKRIKSDKSYKSLVNPLINIWNSLEDSPLEK